MEQYRKTPRAKFLDYEGGDYFITICTANRKHYFGEIYDGEMHLTPIGLFVTEQLTKASTFSVDIEIPLFVVMPNHIHAMVSIHGNMDLTLPAEQRSPNPALRANETCQRHIPTLGRFISSLKGAVTKYARSIDTEFSWQGRYHDHFIRGNHDGNNIAEYIINNISRWTEDCFNDSKG